MVEYIPIEQFLPTSEECRRLIRYNRLLRTGLSPESEFAALCSKDGGDYCVYCLSEDGKRIRYIGITNQPAEKRLSQHLADRQRGKNIYKENWLRSCAERNIKVRIHVVRAGLTAQQAGFTEELLIKLLKKPFSLTNTHSGGSTGYAGLSDESREKHRINTKNGLLLSIERELESIDMERGYCLLDEGYSDDESLSKNESKTTLASRRMDHSQTPESCPLQENFRLVINEAQSWKEKFRKVIREKALSWRTEETYRNWAERFSDFISPRKPEVANKTDVEKFLSALAIDQNKSRSSQKQAVNSIFFLMQDVLHIDLGEIEFITAENNKNQPLTVLSKDECNLFFAAMDGQQRLMAQLMYSSGLRLKELLTLRVKHLEIEKHHLNIQDSYLVSVDRVMPLPSKLVSILSKHLERLNSLWTIDQELASFGGVWLPQQLSKVYPKAGLAWGWQWLFPSKTLSYDAKAKINRRNHVSDGAFQKALASASRRAGIQTPLSPNILRRSFASHLVDTGVEPRTVFELIRIDMIQERAEQAENG